jgi:ERCC4-related helicase
MSSNRIAPGARIAVRDAEWLVRQVAPTARSGRRIHAQGVSGLVRNKNAIFLENFEREIRVVDPRETELRADNSPYYIDTRLYLDGHFRKALPESRTPVIADQAAIDDLPFQREPAEKALKAPSARILVADDVGLGKTLEAGILTSELIRRGRGDRILVVATKSMLTQFQKEFWSRFAIPLTRLDSVGIQRVRARIPTNHNPFHYFDRAIISIDTLKNDLQYRTAIENAWWDIIVIDEAHNVAERRNASGSRSQRHRLADLLSRRSDALLMLSATPHDGSRRSFASLMEMLDSTAIPDPENYGPEDIRGLFVRRFRTDPAVKRDLAEVIPERHTEHVRAPASASEEAAYAALDALSLGVDRQARAGARLFRTTLEKALFSSPAACRETLDKRLWNIAEGRQSDPHGDRPALEHLREAVAAITAPDFTRYQRLLTLLREIGWDGRDTRDRLVVFTERIATAQWLAERLEADLNLPADAVTQLHGSGGMSDVEVQQRVDDFGREQSPIRLLVATDLASEGINLHYLCHKLVHFDLPWSLMKFQQRNGRIDRYGQTRQPRVWYLVTESQNPRIGGDLRVLEVLIGKEEQARQNLGDPSVLMGTIDEVEQEDTIARALEDASVDAKAFATQLDANAEDTSDNEINLFEQLLQSAQTGAEQGQGNSEGRGQVAAMPTVFADTFTYVAEALERLERLNHDVSCAIDRETRSIELDVPDDLYDQRGAGLAKGGVDARWMPLEAVPKDGVIRLTDDTRWMDQVIYEARGHQESSWPARQYLWDVHPLLDWVADKTGDLFGRQAAPVMRVEDRLDPEEVLFLFNSVIPNKRGRPLLDLWSGVRFHGYTATETCNLAGVASLLQLDRARPNPGDVRDDDLAARLGEAVDRAQTAVRQRRKTWQDTIDDEVEDMLTRLEERRGRHKAHLRTRIDPEKGIRKAQEAKLEREIAKVDQRFNEYWDWVTATLQTEDDPNPYVRLIAVFRG